MIAEGRLENDDIFLLHLLNICLCYIRKHFILQVGIPRFEWNLKLFRDKYQLNKKVLSSRDVEH